MAIEKLNENVEVIVQLADEPNLVDGLSAEELKAKFDEGPRIIKEYINGKLVPPLNIAILETGRKADNAVQMASEAVDTAEAANETADGAVRIAEEASTNAMTAVTAAEAAVATANEAESTAESANTAASAAQGASQRAESAASQAVATAQGADARATAAQEGAAKAMNAITQGLQAMDGKKQDKLTAGQNITITDNVISATGGGGLTPEQETLLNGAAQKSYVDAELSKKQAKLSLDQLFKLNNAVDADYVQQAIDEAIGGLDAVLDDILEVM